MAEHNSSIAFACSESAVLRRESAMLMSASFSVSAGCLDV
jgi:hypothetical protein